MTAAMVLFLGVSGERARCAGGPRDSARSFRHYFHALKDASLSPLERVVFSLVLANTKNTAPADSGT